MANEDELKKETEKKAPETTQNPELTPKEQQAQKKLLSMATMKELLTAINKSTKEMQANPKAKQIQEEKLNQLLMLGFILVEPIPGLELTNDAAKIASFGKDVVSKGKKAGLFANMYIHVPTALKPIFEAIDLVTPLPVAEVWQMAGDQLNIWKLEAGIAKDTLSIASKNIGPVFRQPAQVAQAAKQFRPAMA